jgi:hypothetical protein
MILSIALALAPFLGKFALYIVDKFIKKEADRVAARKAVLAAMHDYNVSAVDSANLHNDYEDLIKQYLESRKPVEPSK